MRRAARGGGALAPALACLLAAAGGTAQDAPADPQPERVGHHCLDEERTKWVLHHLLVAQVNPAGAESSARLGLCTPLITRPGVLFAYTSLEVGVLKYLSPAYGQLGGYVQVTPLSLLQLRAELSGLTYWPFPFDRAGYFDLAGYGADFTADALPRAQAGSATGWNLNLIGVLRLRIPLSPRLAAVVLSMWTAEHWVVGDADFYFNLRRELPLARRDWIVTNESVAAAELSVDASWRLRLGLFESWKHVPASDYGANLLGLFLGAHWPRPTGLLEGMRDLQPFLRVGIYTAHRFREGTVYGLAGVLSSYDLGGL